jgi:alanine-glyoxylate transaminase/(R)-3-amino-2-methylpropionate-pyruvate transaminase
MFISRLYTGENKVVSLRNGYHGLVGNTQGITNVGSWNQPTFRGVDHEKLAFPSFYRGTQSTVEGYIKDAEEVYQCNTSGKVACFISEPIMGAGGIQPMPDGYLKNIY